MRPGTWLTPLDLDRWAEGLATEYRGYLIAITGALAATFERPDARSGRARSDLTTTVKDELQNHYSHMSGYVQNAVIAAIDAALTSRREKGEDLTAEQVDELYSLAGEAATDVIDDLLAAMTRDAVVIRRAWRQFAMDSFLVESPRMGPKQAMLKTRQGKIAALQFRQPDGAGRFFPSALWARIQLRWLLVRTQAETALYVMKMNGVDQATATWADGRENVTFSISQEYLELRDGLFHPNSTARIE